MFLTRRVGIVAGETLTGGNRCMNIVALGLVRLMTAATQLIGITVDSKRHRGIGSIMTGFAVPLTHGQVRRGHQQLGFIR